MFVEERRKNTRDSRLADLAADRILVRTDSLHDVRERLELLDLDYIEEVGAGHREVGAEVIVHGVSGLLHLGLGEEHIVGVSPVRLESGDRRHNSL